MLQTGDLIGAARVLTKSYPSVLIRSRCYNQRPVRMAPVRIAELAPITVRSGIGKVEFGSGRPIMYQKVLQWAEAMPAHDAQLLVECPQSVKLLTMSLRATAVVAVIYHPRTWEPHYETVRGKVPSVEYCKMFWRLLKDGEGDPGVCGAVGLPPAIVISDHEMMNALSVDNMGFSRVRRMTLKRSLHFKRIYKIALRIPPVEPDRLAVYDAIRKLPALDGYHYAVDEELKTVHRRWWEVVTILSRRGHLLVRDIFGYYTIDVDYVPYWNLIEKKRKQALDALDEVKTLVEGLPSLQIR